MGDVSRILAFGKRGFCERGRGLRMRIHPTALVDPAATLAENVVVGAWSSVGPGVTLGSGCVVGERVTLEGTVVAGNANHFGHGSIVGSPPQDFAYRPEFQSGVQIGEGNTFRECVTIHRGTKDGSQTVIGNRCYLMTGSHLGHNACLGDGVILANNCLLGGYVTLHDGVVGGGATLFHQFITVGAYAITRGGSRYSKDIPPYCTGDMANLVVGINAVGLRRAGFSGQERSEIRTAFKLVFRSGLNVSQALEEGDKREWSPKAKVFFDFLRSSKRGLCAGSLAVDRRSQPGENE